MLRICVFAGASPGKRPEYLDAARALGAEAARRGLGVVYGGASVGLMGACADAALAGGADVTGVLPRALSAREIAHHGLTELRIVHSLHERKAVMHALSDIVVALPGGGGTLDELFEMVTWRQLGLHDKPIGLLDAAGYWQPLLAFLDHAVAQGFVSPAVRNGLVVRDTAPALLEALLTDAAAAAARGAVSPDARQSKPPPP